MSVFLLISRTNAETSTTGPGYPEFRLGNTHYQLIDQAETYEDGQEKCQALETSVPGSGFVPRPFREDSEEKGRDANSILKGLKLFMQN